jgi:hypothetical protein
MLHHDKYSIKISTITYEYYLSDKIPSEFDFSKVGKSSSGKYLIYYNEKRKEMDYYTIRQFDATTFILFYEMKNKDKVLDPHDTNSLYVRVTNRNSINVRLNGMCCTLNETTKNAVMNGYVEYGITLKDGVVETPSRFNVNSTIYTVTSIADSAFVNCTALSSVTIPGSVQKPGMYVFRGCKNLVSATLQEGIPYVDTGMFVDCEKLTSVSIPESATHIWSVAFSGCKSLASLTLPSKLAKIEGTVFRNCPSLKTITCLATTPPELRADGTTFNGFDRSQCTLVVPKGCATKYRAATGWKEFKEIVEQTL